MFLNGDYIFIEEEFSCIFAVILSLLHQWASHHEIEPDPLWGSKSEDLTSWQIPEMRFEWVLIHCMSMARLSPVRVWFAVVRVGHSPASPLFSSMHWDQLVEPLLTAGASPSLFPWMFFSPFGASSWAALLRLQSQSQLGVVTSLAALRYRVKTISLHFLQSTICPVRQAEEVGGWGRRYPGADRQHGLYLPGACFPVEETR